MFGRHRLSAALAECPTAVPATASEAVIAATNAQVALLCLGELRPTDQKVASSNLAGRTRSDPQANDPDGPRRSVPALRDDFRKQTAATTPRSRSSRLPRASYALLITNVVPLADRLGQANPLTQPAPDLVDRDWAGRGPRCVLRPRLELRVSTSSVPLRPRARTIVGPTAARLAWPPDDTLRRSDTATDPRDGDG